MRWTRRTTTRRKTSLGQGAAPGERPVTMVYKLQSRIMRVIHEHRGDKFISHLKTPATGAEGRRGLVGIQGISSEGAMALVTSPGIYRGERTTPELQGRHFDAVSPPITRTSRTMGGARQHATSP